MGASGWANTVRTAAATISPEAFGDSGQHVADEMDSASTASEKAARPGQAPDRASTRLDVQDPVRILVTDHEEDALRLWTRASPPTIQEDQRAAEPGRPKGAEPRRRRRRGDHPVGQPKLHRSRRATFATRSRRPRNPAGPTKRTSMGERACSVPRGRTSSRPQGHASLTAAPGRPRSAAVTEPAAALQRAHERLRQYFPKGTDLNDVSRAQLATVAVKMNGRPRGVRNWRTPAEAYHDLVATAA